ncbi:MAG: glycosyltransferase family 39 protein [Sphingomonas sp.]|uniref:glycosyltransferase family 39 protein n=1 Tax=Sphingomonas sp. TaxID=28214 RepID=UPI0017BD9B8C|nr:glycosyltransferase family 39 protein [Sphingomonas sp.]MBA3666323.1 glycosyltransferase family 39 protein [Sphingomonas sp.]
MTASELGRGRAWPRTLLPIVLLAGLALRLIQVTSEPLWTDEALTLLLARFSVEKLLFAPVDPTPGLYYSLFKVIVPPGADILAARLPSIVLGTASIFLVYLAGQLAMSQRAGLTAAALFAVSLPMIDYSQEARAYSLLIFLVLLSMIGFLAWFGGIPNGRIRIGAIFGFAAATVLSFYTQFTAVFWIVPIVMVGGEMTKRLGDARAQRLYLAAKIGMALFAVPELVRLYLRGTTFGGLGWLPNVDLQEFLATVGDVLIPAGYWNGREPALSIWSALALGLSVGLIAWRLAARRSTLRESITVEAVAVIVVLMTVPALVWLFGFVVTPIFMPRAILLAVPGFILLLALWAEVERKPWLAPLLVCVYAGSLLITGTIRPREPWRSVARLLSGPAGRGEAIMICPQWRGPSLRHALGASVKPSLYFMFDQRVMIMSPSMSGRDWEQNYLRAIIRPIVDQGSGSSSAALGSRVVATPAVFWIVESECSPEQVQARRQWLGAGVERQMLDLPATPLHAGIRVLKFESQARPRSVLIPSQVDTKSGAKP